MLVKCDLPEQFASERLEYLPYKRRLDFKFLFRDNPREIRNRAEKMRRDRLNQSVAELAAMVPPVVAARRKIDKTTVLRLTAHYLRAHQYGQYTVSKTIEIIVLYNVI